MWGSVRALHPVAAGELRLLGEFRRVCDSDSKKGDQLGRAGRSVEGWRWTGGTRCQRAFPRGPVSLRSAFRAPRFSVP